MRGEPNELLRSARAAAGLTQGQLAELANAQIARETAKSGAMDADYIGKLERGVHRWPNRHYRAALRQVLGRESDAELGFFSTRSRAATVGEGVCLAIGGDGVERKAFVRAIAGSVAGLAFTDPLKEFVGAVVGSGGRRRVGGTEVDQVRRMARMFAEQDHAYGGGFSVHAALAQLASASHLLEGRTSHQAARRQLFSSVADLADTAAGMCFDAGMHQQARRCFKFAVECATESDDWGMRAKALSGLANLAVHRAQPDDALSFAEMAMVRADRLTPTVRAVMHTRHARALGLSGGHRAGDCVTATRRAEEVFAARCGEEPDWITYYDQAHVERDIGRALLHLALNGGDHTGARDRLATAVARFPQGYSRGKALATANLAHLTMVRDDPAHAAALGHQALDTMGPVRSDRVFDALRQVRVAGRAYRRLPAVRELDQRLDESLRSPVL